LENLTQHQLNLPGWVKDAVFYEIFPDRFNNGDKQNDPPDVSRWGDPPTRDNFFGGDLQGILDKLDYLEELGITALYLTPIFKANTNHKYDTADYLEIDPAFGSIELLKKLVSKAHNKGIRVVLDGVFNHCGYDFWAFQDVRKNGATSRFAQWFFPQSFPIQNEPPNYSACFGAGDLPKLNTTNPDVIDYLLKVGTYWIEKCDIDGWRLDTAWKVPMDFWRAFRERIKNKKPDAYIVGEVFRYMEHWVRGDTLDATMNYCLRDQILYFCSGEYADSEDFDYDNRCLQAIYGATAPYQLNVLDSHDRMRLMTYYENDIHRIIMAVVFNFTYMGAPLVYYGDEIGMHGGNDPDCRRTMIWDESEWNGEINTLYRTLIQVRNTHPALRSINFQTLLTFNGVYAYHRFLGEDEAIVIMNPNQDSPALKIPLPKTTTKTQWRDLLTGKIFTAISGYLCFDKILEKSTYLLFPL